VGLSKEMTIGLVVFTYAKLLLKKIGSLIVLYNLRRLLCKF